MLLSLLVACGSPDANTLEPPEASLNDCDEGCAGVVAVETGAAEGDWNLVAEAFTLHLHLPGRSDLALLDGAEVSVSGGEIDKLGGYGDARSVSLSDASGPLLVLSTTADGGDAVFGAGFARPGEEDLGRSRVGDYNLTHHPVVFATDEGEVTVGAGEPTTLTVDGVLWRVVVHAAYAAEHRPALAQSYCMGMPDALSYEAVRVESAEAEDLLARPKGERIPEDGC